MSDPPPNPFSSRFIRPGAMPYLYPHGESAAGVRRRFEESGRRGAILGPHGSGKSALLRDLLTVWRGDAGEVRLIELRDGQRGLPAAWPNGLTTSPRVLIAIDGYEQLGRLARWRLRSACWRRGWGLLVTAHDPVGLPTLAQTSSDLKLVRRIVARLLQSSPAATLVPAEALAACYQRHAPNVREMLFELYDLIASAPHTSADERWA